MRNKVIQSQLLRYVILFTLLSTVLYGALIYQLVFLIIRHRHLPISEIVPWTLLFLALFVIFMFSAYLATRKLSKLLETAEDAFQKSHWKYRHIFESSVDIFVQTDLEGIIQMVSPSIKTMSGWDPEELIGQPVTQYYGDASLRSELVQLLFDQKSVFDFTTTALGKNGSRAIVSVNSVLTYDDQTGQPNGIMSWIRDVTEQKRLQEALSESQKRMGQIIDFLPDATFAIDREGVVIAWNRAMEDLTGFKAEDIIGKGNNEYSITIYGTRRPSIIDHVLNQTELVQDNYYLFDVHDNIITAETNLTTRDGNDVFLWMKAVPLYDCNGSITGAIETIRDITERKYAEDTFNKAFHANATPLSITNAGAGTYIEVNEALLSAIGYTKEEMIGKTPYELGIYSYEQALYIADYFAVSHSIRNMEMVVSVKEGTQKIVLINADLVHLANNPCFLSSVYDITWRKEMEETLRQNEAKYRQLTERINDLLWTCTLDLKLTYISPSVERILGYTQEESLRFGVSRKITPKSLQMIQNMISSTLALDKDGRFDSDSTFTLEFECYHRDGSIRYFESIVSPIIDDNGRLIAVQGISRDITARKQAEQELKETKQRMSDIIDFLPDPTMVIDINGKVISWNKAAEQILGARAEDMIGKDNAAYSRLFYGYQRPLLIDMALDQSQSSDYPFMERRGNVLVGENFCPVIGKSGAYIRATASLLYDSTGNVMGAIETFRDSTEQKLAEEKTKYLSMHDALTGVYNRAYCEEELNRIHMGRTPCYGIMVFDIDGLKLINDSFGHQAGDKLLIAAAHVIQESLREGEVISRIGGDEFMVLIPNADIHVLENITLRIKMNETQYNNENPGLPLSVSIGYATMGNNYLESNIYDMYRQADNLMYREKLRHKQSSRNVMVTTLLKALEAKDVVTKEHAVRLQKLAVSLAFKMGLSRQQINDIKLLSQFHDIGKVGVSDSILMKPGPLTDEERKEMQRHCEIGNHIALASPDLAPIADWILKHQEWWDGHGYPLGVKGDDIPLECRIISIADAFDAMTSDRPYRKAMSQEDAIDELKRSAGKQFDPLLVLAFIEMISEEKAG